LAQAFEMSMAEQSLVDLGPILQVMLLGLLLAMGPLAWVWLRGGASPGARLRALTYLTLFLTFDLVLFGAFTRLTDSGLGCPDWPGCYGSASPVGAQAEISQAQAQLPSGPVTHKKAWIEMIHRYLATGVGVLILTLAVYSWVQRRQAQINPWWASFTLLWVCVQGAFGALTVTMKLFPAIVTLHLLGGMFLLALLQMQAQRYALAQGHRQGQEPRATLTANLRTLLLATMAALWLQMALGGWVSTNYAVLACGSDFPTCQGSWWPRMNFVEGFELWRPLGQTGAGANVSLEALTAIHYVHRVFAYIVLALMAALAWRLWQAQGWQRSARWLAGLAALQLITGLSNVVLGWPLLAAVMHTGGAAALVLVTTAMAVHAWPQRQVLGTQAKPAWMAQEGQV
jgi:heme a synthase